MTDRARLVYALLRTLLAWTPTPRSRTASAPGFVSTERLCLHCKTTGRWHPELRRKVDAGCPHCGGTGTRPVKDLMDDPLKSPPPHPMRKTGFGGVAGDDAREARRRRDEEIERLGQQLSTDEQDAPADELTRAVDLRDRLYRHGSYADLEHALHVLRQTRPLAYTAAMWVAYQPLGEAPIECDRPAIAEICETLGMLIDGPIRVPAFVPVSESAEAERLAREGKGALWRGRGDWHRMRRGERDALIVAMAAEGRSPTEIGLRFNLRRRRVQQIVAEHTARGSAGTASGPAA